MREVAKQPDTWHIQASNPKYKNHVIVIGESVRQDYLSVYGFPLETTPFLDQAPAKIYNGYIAAASYTYPSLLHTLYLTEKHEVNYTNNLITLANSAGFETYWFSNQGGGGETDTFSMTLGRRAAHSFYFDKGMNTNNQPDTDLLPYIDAALSDSTTKPRLIVLHLMGSHPVFCDRVEGIPVEFQYRSKEMSCYLQSLKQTDSLLETIADKLKQNGNNYSMLFFSDHGLTELRDYGKSLFGEVLLRHGTQYRQNYQVPLIEISSEQSTQQHLPLYQSATRFLQGVAEWAGIEADEFKDKPSFWQNSPIPVKVFNSSEWINFDSLPDNPISEQ